MADSKTIELSPKIATKRRVWAQVFLCDGCCCGHTEKGHAKVPTDWLREQWRAHKLTFQVDLSPVYCLGPCDAANVLCVLTPEGSRWLGGLKSEHYPLLLQWAIACRDAQKTLPLPPEFDGHDFERFQN